MNEDPKTRFELDFKDIEILRHIHEGITPENKTTVMRMQLLGLLYLDSQNTLQLTPMGNSWLYDAVRARH